MTSKIAPEDPWQQEQLRSLLDGRARYKAVGGKVGDRRAEMQTITLGGREYKYLPAPITLPSGYEPAYLR